MSLMLPESSEAPLSGLDAAPAGLAMPDLLPALPEVCLLILACVILLVDVWLKNARVTHILTLATLFVTAALVVFGVGAETRYTFGGQFVDDAMGDVLKLFATLASAAALVYSREYLAARGLMRGEYHVLTLFALLGMLVMISANHFLVLYVGLELLSLALYALVAMQRESVRATEAAMKYFVLGALASGLLLYGMSLIYGLTGALDLPSIALSVHGIAGTDPLLAFGLVFIVAGLGFKLGVAPFHMWAPDIYHGAPTAVTLFLGSAPKLAAFAFAMRLLVDGLEPAIVHWQGMLVVMATLSLVIGNLAAIMQTNLKRMLAYSTIAHMGFLLLALLTGSEAGYSAGLFYAVTYVLMSLASFGLVTYLSQNGLEAETLDDYKGLNARHPWLAALMAIVMFAMAGIPPFIGFYAKLSVLQALVGAGWVWLAAFAVALSLIGAFYYLRVVKLLYFDAPHADAPRLAPRHEARALLSANGLAILLLGIAPQPLIALCAEAMHRTLG